MWRVFLSVVSVLMMGLLAWSIWSLGQQEKIMELQLPQRLSFTSMEVQQLHPGDEDTPAVLSLQNCGEHPLIRGEATIHTQEGEGRFLVSWLLPGEQAEVSEINGKCLAGNIVAIQGQQRLLSASQAQGVAACLEGERLYVRSRFCRVIPLVRIYYRQPDGQVCRIEVQQLRPGERRGFWLRETERGGKILWIE